MLAGNFRWNECCADTGKPFHGFARELWRTRRPGVASWRYSFARPSAVVIPRCRGYSKNFFLDRAALLVKPGQAQSAFACHPRGRLDPLQRVDASTFNVRTIHRVTRL